VDNHAVFPIHPRPGCSVGRRVDLRFDGWRSDIGKLQLGDASPLPGVSLPVRLEYISSTGSLANGAPNLLYGPGSNAWSITLTPTYQYKIFFVRAEFSHVKANSTTPGLAFGPGGTNTTQTRGVFEIGFLF